MKICPKCNTGNKDNTLNCKDCGASINNEKTLDKSQITKDYIKKEEKKQFKKQIIKITSIILVVLVYLILFIKASSKDNFLLITLGSIFFATAGYLNIFHPEFLFMLKNISTIQNIDEVELTDFYLLTSMISGIFLIIGGMIFMFMQAM